MNIQLFLALSTIAVSSLSAFHSLQQVNSYIKHLDEYPDADYPQTWANPSYKNIYTTARPSLVGKALQRLNLVKKRIWNVEQFAARLHDHVSHIAIGNFKEYVMGKVLDNTPIRFYTFGNIHGSLQSFVRSLENLRESNVIDDEFNLLNPTDHIVILGNAIDIGPYSLETIALILELQQKNPDRVFFLRGEHEEKLFWHTYSLFQEAQLRNLNVSEQLTRDLQIYFESLPQAIYLKDRSEKPELLCLKCESLIEKEELWEDYLQDFFASLQSSTFIKEITYDNKKNSRSLYPRVIVETRNEWQTILPTPALAIKLSTKPLCTIYSLASCPSRAFRFLYRLFFDAYACITCNGTLAQSELTLYQHDVRQNDRAFTAIPYDLVSGDQRSVATKK